MWLTDLLPGASEVCPTCPTYENKVGQHESLGAVALSDLSDLSDRKKVKNILSGENRHKEKEIAQNSSEDPRSVRLLPESVTPEQQSGNQEKPVVGQTYSHNDFSDDEPTPAQLDHARRMLVDCPSTGGKLHCWHCSRCDDARTCAAWRTRRHDVEFFRKSGEPYSLYLVECGAVEVLQ